MINEWLIGVKYKNQLFFRWEFFSFSFSYFFRLMASCSCSYLSFFLSKSFSERSFLIDLMLDRDFYLLSFENDLSSDFFLLWLLRFVFLC